MSKHDYTELDAAILSRIAQKPANFTQLQSGAVQKAADAFVTGSYKPAWRFIDARLQALRKAGKIVYSGKTGWGIADAEALHGIKGGQHGVE